MINPKNKHRRRIFNNSRYKYHDSYIADKYPEKNNSFRINKICSKCKKRKVKHHHYICDYCWNLKELKLKNSNETFIFTK